MTDQHETESDSDSDSGVYVSSTKRGFMGGLAGLVVLQSGDGWSFWPFGDDETEDIPGALDLTVRVNGEVLTEQVSEINLAQNLEADVLNNETDDQNGDIVEVSASGSGGGSAGFEDTDGDGDAELQDNAADFDNKPAKGISALNGGGVVTDGDGTTREIYVIANGASDPADAGAEDIIFEEQ